MKTLGWSLYELDRTHIESLIPFVMRMKRKPGAAQKPTNRLYCDQAHWL